MLKQRSKSLKLFRSICLSIPSFFSIPLFAASPPDLQKIAQTSNTFGIALSQPMNTDEANSVYSPLSLFTCLSMVASGAKGTTLEELKKGLLWQGNADSIAQDLQKLSQQLVLSPSKDCSLAFKNVNGLFADQDTSFLPAFQKIVEENYNANLLSIDFTEQAQATETINEWVANSTQGKIPSLLEPSDIDATTRIVLVNAIYFAGDWLSPFAKEKTTKQSFTVDHTTTRDGIDMMRQVHRFPYLEETSLQILALPFKTCANANLKPLLLILLPSTIEDFDDLQKNLNPSQIKSWLKQVKPQSIDLQLPSFCLRKRYDMKSILASLGIRKAFDTTADFSGIDGMRSLYLSKVIHETYFNLNEKGVEATAATAAAMNTTSMGPAKEKPIPFIANHPFLFLLVDEPTGIILFLGKFTDPAIAGCL